ncbi:MAG: phytase [Pseudomonadota bacterium]
MLRWALGVILLLGCAFAGFVAVMEHPATRGPARCWMQETFYAQEWADAPAGTEVIEAVRVTEPVRDECDAADDPAIWVTQNAGDIRVHVLGTNKQRSINVYDVSGQLISRADDLGAPNNVDMRQSSDTVLAFASDKDDGQIEAFVFDPATGALDPLPGAPFAAVAEDEVYGLCPGRLDEALFVFTTDKSGLIVQYSVKRQGPGWRAREVRQVRVETQPEGCVVDDDAAALFVGEEDVGIWRFDAAPDGRAGGALIAKVGARGELVADVEGLAIYEFAGPTRGYLIASSQGDNTFAVFDRAAPHTFRGRFAVSFGGEQIGDTDGIAVSSAVRTADFPAGLMVLQDGFIRTGGRSGAQEQTGTRRRQRFAYVSFAQVVAALNLAGDDTLAGNP